MPLYTDLSLYSSPYSLHLSGPYSNHSSIIAANVTRPTSAYGKSPRSFHRGYAPHLSTISETQSARTLRGKYAAQILAQQKSPKFQVPKPIKINTADIDVSANKYQKYEDRSSRSPNLEIPRRRNPAESDRPKSPSPAAKPEDSPEYFDQKPIRRDRATVRLRTLHKKSSPSGDSEKRRRWRENFNSNELQTEQKPIRKTQGEVLKDKFTIKRGEENNSNNQTELRKSPSFHDICTEISSDTINEVLNPGQPVEVTKKQTRHYTEEMFKQIHGEENVPNEMASEKSTTDSRASVKRKKKITRKKTNESLASDDENKPRTRQRRVRKTSTSSSLHSDDEVKKIETPLNTDAATNAEEVKPKPKPVITATVDVERPRPCLKIIVDDVKIEEVPSPKKLLKKFKLNVTVEVEDEKKTLGLEKTKLTDDDKGKVLLSQPTGLVISDVKQHRQRASLGDILEGIEEVPKPKNGEEKTDLNTLIPEGSGATVNERTDEQNYVILKNDENKIKNEEDLLSDAKKEGEIAELKKEIKTQNVEGIEEKSTNHENKTTQKLESSTSVVNDIKATAETQNDQQFTAKKENDKASKSELNSPVPKSVASKLDEKKDGLGSGKTKLAGRIKADSKSTPKLKDDSDSKSKVAKNENAPNKLAPKYENQSSEDFWAKLNPNEPKPTTKTGQQFPKQKSVDGNSKAKPKTDVDSRLAPKSANQSAEDFWAAINPKESVFFDRRRQNLPKVEPKLLDKTENALGDQPKLLENSCKPESARPNKLPENESEPENVKANKFKIEQPKLLENASEENSCKPESVKVDNPQIEQPENAHAKKMCVKANKSQIDQSKLPNGENFESAPQIELSKLPENATAKNSCKPEGVEANKPKTDRPKLAPKTENVTGDTIGDSLKYKFTITQPEAMVSENEAMVSENVDEMKEEAEKKITSKRSLVNKTGTKDPDLAGVFSAPPTPEPEPSPEPETGDFVPLSSNRLSQFMHPFKKPEQFDECPVEIFATPKAIRGRHYPRARHPPPPPTPAADSDGEDSDDEESESSDNSESDEESQPNIGKSTSSNDSGFDSSSGSPANDKDKDCDVNIHKKCEKLTANLCGVNQKLIVEAIESVKKGSSDTRDSPTSNPSHNPAFALDSGDSVEEYYTSSTYTGFQKSGRITPPATTIPRFRKYCIDDFNFLKVLGKGSFGKVLLAELKDTEYYYAVKCLKKDVVLEDDDVECTLIERKVLALGTKHPYLCHLLCTFQTESHLFFVMEYLNGGDLMFHIQHSGRFPEPRARFYAAEIVSGLKFLHSKGIVYRDLKLDNILLDFDGHVRIADFGMCKLQIFLDRMADTFCGTPDYMAPEIIKGQHYNQSVDWWSFGVLLYEMLLGQSPFSGCDEDELFWSICNEKPVLPRFLSAEANCILQQLLEKDGAKRLGNKFSPHGDIHDHVFFKQIAWDRLELRQLESPFKPNLQHPLDTQYFDKTFTVEKAKLTPIENNILQSMDQAQFQGFSYTNPNATDR